MFYDASLNYSQDKTIRTTVVYSSEIENAPSQYDGQKLSKRDILNLTFVALMKKLEKKRAELLLVLLTKKFKKVPEDYIEKLKALQDRTIELIGADIFEIEDVKDIEKYF